MKSLRSSLAAGVCMLAYLGASGPAVAAEDAQDSAEASEAGDDVIIVQARRKAESLQDVPISVQAVTSEDLGKLEIRQFEDVTRAVPGLALSKGGSVTNASMRGVAFDARASGASTSVEFYRNDAVISANALFNAVYDVGQIEVLRGPQGTLRGRASPSGSITLTTRRPDLDEVGGYANGQIASRGRWAVNGAINVPVLADKLAVRIAGFVGENEGNGYDGLNLRTNTIDTSGYEKTKSLRASVRADPFDDVLVLDLNYETIRTSARQYNQVQSFSDFNGGAASPVLITPRDRLGIGTYASPQENEIRLYNWQAVLRQAGQVLTYVGAKATMHLEGDITSDPANIFASPYPVSGPINFAPITRYSQYTLTRVKQTSHEIRLQNEERIFGLFDYVLGGFTIDNKSPTELASPSLSTVNTTLVSPTAYTLNNFAYSGTGRYRSEKENSLFANLTLHLGERTELSGGLRHIWQKLRAGVISGGFGTAAAPSSPLAPGGFLIFSRCKGYDDAGCAPTNEATIYTASAKHNFTDDIMLYGSFGTSFRQGNSLVGYGLGTNPPPTVGTFLSQFLDLPDETSKSFEVGFKTAWFDRRLRLNVSAFYQKFKNYPLAGPAVATVDVTTGTPRLVTASSIASPVAMKVKGVEADMSFDIAPNFNLAATLAFADSKIANGQVACVDLNNDNITDATPPTAAALFAHVGANQIDTCTISGLSGSNQPRWSGTAQAEYSIPVGFGDAFLRGFTSWKGNSPGDAVNPNDGFKAYALVDLYAGVRDAEGGWEINGYVKNLFNTRRVLTRGPARLATSISAVAAPINSTNYLAITTNDPREFGLSLRVAFGSR